MSSELPRASLVAQMVKNLTAMWDTWVGSLGWDPRSKECYLLQYPCLENSMDGGPSTEEPGGLYGPWGHKDMTEQLSLCFFTYQVLSEVHDKH